MLIRHEHNALFMLGILPDSSILSFSSVTFSMSHP